jgi:hypothetical protein
MQPENDRSTGTDPSTADVADTGSVAPGPEGEVAEGTPAPQEGVAESGAGSAKGTAGTVSGTATTAAEEQRRPLLADEELDGFPRPLGRGASWIRG